VEGERTYLGRSVARHGSVTEGEAIHSQKSAAGVVLTRVRKAQTVGGISRNAGLDERQAAEEPASVGLCGGGEE